MQPGATPEAPAPDTEARGAQALARAREMLRIAAAYIREHCPHELVRYDDADCDGACVADDCESAADEI